MGGRDKPDDFSRSEAIPNRAHNNLVDYPYPTRKFGYFDDNDIAEQTYGMQLTQGKKYREQQNKSVISNSKGDAPKPDNSFQMKYNGPDPLFLENYSISNHEIRDARLKNLRKIKDDFGHNNPYMILDEVPDEKIVNHYDNQSVMSMIAFEGQLYFNSTDQKGFQQTIIRRMNESALMIRTKPNKSYSTVFYETYPRSFHDTDFPPIPASISADQSKLPHKFSAVKWKKIKDIDINRDLYIFNGEASFLDVTQGDVGNCYFMAPLASFIYSAQNQAKDLVYFSEPNVNGLRYSKIGLYSIRLYCDGTKSETLIDDFIPVNQLTGKTAFAKISNNCLWPLLVEKAWAKVTQGYLNVSSGTCLEGLQAITGAPAENFKIEKEAIAQICQKLYKFLKVEKCVMTACTNHSVKDRSLEPCHAYSLLDIYCLDYCWPDNAGQTLQFVQSWNGEYNSNRLVLVKIRNPWGSSDKYSGEWSFESKKWVGNQDIKKKLYGFNRDGIFLLSIEHFKEYFSEFDVAFYSPSRLHTAIRVEALQNNPFASVWMTVSKRDTYFISVTQPNPRIKPPGYTNEPQQPLKRISLLKTPQTPELIDGLAKNRISLYIEKKLEPGYYLLIVTNIDNFKNAVVDVYSSSTVQLREQQKDIQSVIKTIRYGFTCHAKDMPWIHTAQLMRHKHQLLPNGYGYFLFSNETTQSQQATIYLTEFSNLEFLDGPQKSKCGKEYNVRVGGRSEELIVYRQTNAPCKIKYEIRKTDPITNQNYMYNYR
jgi:Calpain family cysteine protease